MSLWRQAPEAPCWSFGPETRRCARRDAATTCDRGARATTCQTRALEVPKHEANRFFCPVADITANRQAPSFLLGGVPCRMNVIKQTVTATWRRSTVASQEAPQPRCETAISGWQSIIASWPRPRSGAHFLLVRPSGWRVAPRRVPLGRRSPGPPPPTRPSTRRPITFFGSPPKPYARRQI